MHSNFTFSHLKTILVINECVMLFKSILRSKKHEHHHARATHHPKVCTKKSYQEGVDGRRKVDQFSLEYFQGVA